MQQNHGPRYTVEPGTDGSWLVVDRGADLQQRRAIGRYEHRQDAQDAQDEAAALSSLEGLTSGLGASGSSLGGVDDMIADLTAAIDAEHNFDHLLPPQ